jgi:phosphate transport system substrate-binding protein
MKYSIILAFTSLVFFACGNGNESKKTLIETNRISVAVDESLRPVIEAEEMVFESINDQKQIDFIYTNPAEAMRLMLADSCKLAIIPRKANAAEQVAIDQEQYKFSQVKVAIDALAFIVNNENTDTVFTVNQI